MSYYDKQGQPLESMQRFLLFEDLSYRRVGLTWVGDKEVSTVWLGIDQGCGDVPLIFETMVFSKERDELECQRWSTLKEAEAGHAAAVERAIAESVDDETKAKAREKNVALLDAIRTGLGTR